MLATKKCSEQPHGQSTYGNIYSLHADDNRGNSIDLISLFHSLTSNDLFLMTPCKIYCDTSVF